MTNSRYLEKFLALDDFEAAARRHLPRPIFEYIAGATETNASLKANRKAFETLQFVPRVLVDVSRRSSQTTLFGEQYASPFGIAPMGIVALGAFRGDLVLARAAAQADIPMVMSGSSLIPMEEVAKAAPRTWFQAYLPGEPEQMTALLERVARAGFKTLVITVDSAVVPNRENNVRAGFKTPLTPSLRLALDGITHPAWTVGTFLRTLVQHGMMHFENNYAHRGAPIISRRAARDFAGRERLTWLDISRLRAQWKGNLLIKGVMHVKDAMTARDTGLDGVIISNHGGRQLDGAVSPMLVLPKIREALPEFPLLIDSGFRRGTDVLKALALGANLVLVGRPFNYAATIGGEPAASHAISLLAAEVRASMGLLGVNRVEELRDISVLCTEENRTLESLIAGSIFDTNSVPNPITDSMVPLETAGKDYEPCNVSPRLPW